MVRSQSETSQAAFLQVPPSEVKVDLAASCIWVLSQKDDRLEDTFAMYVEALSRLPWRAELIVMNDGAGSEVSERVAAAGREAPLPVKILSLHRETGESNALSLAFGSCSGEIVVFLPPYLQIDPVDIASAMEPVRRGELDYVASWRHARVDTRSAAWKSRVFNWLTSRLTGVNLHDINCGLRVMRREVLEQVAIYGDLHRFLPVLAAQQGFRVGEVKVRHLEERVNPGDYRVGVYVRRLLDLLTLFFLIKFTRKPLRFFGLIGTAVLAVGMVILVTVLIERILGQPLGDRPLLVLGVLLIVLGAQSFSMGLLGELIIFFHASDVSKCNVEKVYERKER